MNAYNKRTLLITYILLTAFGGLLLVISISEGLALETWFLVAAIFGLLAAIRSLLTQN